jgi:hypothetical protein
MAMTKGFDKTGEAMIAVIRKDGYLDQCVRAMCKFVVAFIPQK